MLNQKHEIKNMTARGLCWTNEPNCWINPLKKGLLFESCKMLLSIYHYSPVIKSNRWLLKYASVAVNFMCKAHSLICIIYINLACHTLINNTFLGGCHYHIPQFSHISYYLYFRLKVSDIYWNILQLIARSSPGLQLYGKQYPIYDTALFNTSY